MASSPNRGDYGSGRFRRRRNDQGSRRPEKEKEASTANVDVNSPVIQAFQRYQVELDNRNDCFERIVKLSRDITIESKRLIFLLHRVTGSDDKNTILTEAAARLIELRTDKFLPLAKELNGQDPYQFLRAFSPGLQEYIEAVTFYHYLTNNKLVSWDSIQAELTFALQSTDSQSATTRNFPAGKAKPRTDISVENNEGSLSISNPEGDRGQDAQIVSEQSADLPASIPTTLDCVHMQTVSVPVPPTEYMLGVADFTGELMKMAINCVGSGDLNTPTVVAEMMRAIHDACALFGNIPRHLRQKIRVLRQSLQKVETACYAMKVRGSEMPTHMLVDVFTTASSGTNDIYSMDEPEEFYD